MLHTATDHASNVHQVVRWFALPSADPPAPAQMNPPPVSGPGQILLITGGSGSGKSSLLRVLRRRVRRQMRWINLPAIRLPDRPLVDCFNPRPLEQTLELLNRVGLAEARSYLSRPRHLSDGQRWRLRLAMALHRADAEQSVNGSQLPPILVCDEFAALLDRITAAVVARALRRTIDAHPHLRAVIVTSHDDLTAALRPDRHVRCDFGQWEEVVSDEC